MHIKYELCPKTLNVFVKTCNFVVKCFIILNNSAVLDVCTTSSYTEVSCAKKDKFICYFNTGLENVLLQSLKKKKMNKRTAKCVHFVNDHTLCPGRYMICIHTYILAICVYSTYLFMTALQ